MATVDRCPFGIDTTRWDVPGGFDTTFRWKYEQGRPALETLYTKAKKLQWDGDRRIDGSQDLDPENPMELPDEAVLIYGSPVWDKLEPKQRAQLRHHQQAWQISQFLHGEQGALICTAKIVQQVPDMDAKDYAATQVMDEARHVAFGRLALRDYYPELTEKERDEREEFAVEGCYLMRDRFLAPEIMETLGLPARECAEFVEKSPLMQSHRTALFRRIVPTIKEIGLWGPRIRRAYADMGILGFADVDGEAHAREDETIAERFDAEQGRAS